MPQKCSTRHGDCSGVGLALREMRGHVQWRDRRASGAPAQRPTEPPCVSTAARLGACHRVSRMGGERQRPGHARCPGPKRTLPSVRLVLLRTGVGKVERDWGVSCARLLEDSYAFHSRLLPAFSVLCVKLTPAAPTWRRGVEYWLLLLTHQVQHECRGRSSLRSRQVCDRNRLA